MVVPATSGFAVLQVAVVLFGSTATVVAPLGAASALGAVTEPWRPIAGEGSTEETHGWTSVAAKERKSADVDWTPRHSATLLVRPITREYSMEGG